MHTPTSSVRTRLLAPLLVLALFAAPAITAQSTEGPDLRAASLVLSPGDPRPGDLVRFEAVVHNDGGEDSGPYGVRFLLDGGLYSEHRVTSTGTDERTTVVSPPWTATEGGHEISVLVDTLDEVDETDETDNDATTPFDILPDLVVVALTQEPLRPAVGETVHFSAAIENQGDATAERFGVSFFVDHTERRGRTTVVNLAPGDRVTVESQAWQATFGEHLLVVSADARDEVSEGNEANNEMRDRFVAGPDASLADLVVTDAEAIISGEPVAFRATVQNHNDETLEALTVRFLVDDHLRVSEVVIEDLPGGERRTVRSDDWVATKGPHVVRAVLDPRDTLRETDETNNIATLAIDVVPPASAHKAPDLEVASLRITPAQPIAGDVVMVHAVVKNDGNETAPAALVRFTLDADRVLDEDTVGPLDPQGLARTSAGPWKAAAGEHIVSVAADPFRTVDEQAELNNVATRTFQVASDDDPDPAPEDETIPGVSALVTVVAALVAAAALRRR